MARFDVAAPVADFDGEVGGVRFAAGRAVIDDTTHAAALAYCRGAGYAVAEVEGEQDGTPALPKKSASADTWRAYAVANGMTAEEAETLTRDQLVERFTNTEEESA